MGKGVRMQIEDGSFLNGWLINLRGMPSRELMSLRRVRMEMRADVTLTEEILQSIHQLRQEQGQDLWEVACDKQDSVVAQGSVSSKSRQKLHTIESLQARADQVLQDSWANPTIISLQFTVLQYSFHFCWISLGTGGDIKVQYITKGHQSRWNKFLSTYMSCTKCPPIEASIIC